MCHLRLNLTLFEHQYGFTKQVQHWPDCSIMCYLARTKRYIACFVCSRVQIPTASHFHDMLFSILVTRIIQVLPSFSSFRNSARLPHLLRSPSHSCLPGNCWELLKSNPGGHADGLLPRLATPAVDHDKVHWPERMLAHRQIQEHMKQSTSFSSL
jgi:hypothetical protein